MRISARFYLKEPGAAEPTLIYLIVKYGAYVFQNGQKKYRHFKYSTGLKVQPVYWDRSHCRVISKKGHGSARSINPLLNKYEDFIVNACRQAQLDGQEISNKWLKTVMDEKFRPKSKSESFSLLQFWKSIQQPTQG
jgi:hypothetical protein